MARDDKGNGKGAGEPQSSLSVEPFYELGTFATTYSNFASISHTKDELCIDFCLVAPPHMVDLGEKRAQVPVVARVLIPPSMVNGLVDALKAQHEKLSKDGDQIVLSVRKSKEGTKK